VLRVVDTAELCPHSPVKSTRKIRQLPGQLASLLSATGNYYAMLIGLDRLRTRSVRKPRAQANDPGQPKDVAMPPKLFLYHTRCKHRQEKIFKFGIEIIRYLRKYSFFTIVFEGCVHICPSVCPFTRPFVRPLVSTQSSISVLELSG